MNSTLAERYASQDITNLFSKETRYKKWRLVWLHLAEAQFAMGFPINLPDLEACQKTFQQIDFDRVAEIEAETRHDVMAHLKYWAEICPAVNNTIHLGATSSFVTDNAECALHKEALFLIASKVKNLCQSLAPLAKSTAGLVVSGYTHFQPASPTTIGKRIAMWIQDLMADYNDIMDYYTSMVCRGVKGTTGTQASYAAFLDQKDCYDKIDSLDQLFARKLGFKRAVELSGQTISRKQDAKIGDLLSGLAITLSKIGNDVRLLSHTGDLREGFAKGQVGSSAMPYKRNPMLAERLCALSRTIPQYRDMLTQTAMVQWLERSLDDSALRRVALPDMFLAADGALNTALKLSAKLDPVEQPEKLKDQDFMSSEVLIARAVKRGHSRQLAHEKLKSYSLKSRDKNLLEDFWDNVLADPIWKGDKTVKSISLMSLKSNTGPVQLSGLAETQTLKFLERHKSFLEF